MSDLKRLGDDRLDDEIKCDTCQKCGEALEDFQEIFCTYCLTGAYQDYKP